MIEIGSPDIGILGSFIPAPHLHRVSGVTYILVISVERLAALIRARIR